MFRSTSCNERLPLEEIQEALAQSEKIEDKVQECAEDLHIVMPLLQRKSPNVKTGAAINYCRSFAIMFIDLDKFKHINDTYGHNVGDKILLMVGERLQACVVCRWG